ncbi:MAG: hypothetical protein R3B96_19895 [Pirellulaceae bacterium]
MAEPAAVDLTCCQIRRQRLLDVMQAEGWTRVILTSYQAVQWISRPFRDSVPTDLFARGLRRTCLGGSPQGPRLPRGRYRRGVPRQVALHHA